MNDRFRMRPIQKRAYEALYGQQFQILNAPTGAGKSLQIIFSSAREMDENPKQKVLIVVPQTIIAKGFGPCTLVYPDGKHLSWDPGYNLCDATERERVAKVREFLTTPRKDLEHGCMICTHKSLAMAYASLKNKKKAFRHITIWIDEAHHILISERGDSEHAVVCNQIGNMVKYIIDLNDRSAKLGLATAFFFRGDRASIIPQRHMRRFKRFHVPLDEYWNQHVKHIKSYVYDFIVYKHSYYDNITHIFRKRLGKTIIYVPWPNSSLSPGDKYKHVNKIIKAIRKSRPKAKIIDLVNEQGRAAKKQLVNSITKRSDVDVIIAMGIFREGADWVWADRVIDLAPSNSLQLQGQKFGRLIRDVPGKRRIEYFNFLPFVLDTLDEEKYRRSLSERFAAFTASLLIEDLVTPIKFPLPQDKKKRKKEDSKKTNWFAKIVSDETERQHILNQVVQDLSGKAAELEIEVERGDRVSKAPTAAEADQVITRVLQKNGIGKHLREVCKHIQLLLARKTARQRSIDVQSLVDAGFDKVVKYGLEAIFSFGAGQCGCKTFREFHSVLKKRNFYPTPEEWRKAVQREGIGSVTEYREKHKADPRLYRNPDKAYGIRWNKLMARPDKYETVEEWREAVKRLGIGTHREYQLRHKQDPRLVHTPMRTFDISWNELIGKRFYKTVVECRRAIKKLGIRTRTEYFQRYKEDPRLPSSPSYYGISWMELAGKTQPDFYTSLPRWLKVVKKHDVVTKADYARARKQDPRLHSTPCKLFAKDWAELIGKKHKRPGNRRK